MLVHGWYAGPLIELILKKQMDSETAIYTFANTDISDTAKPNFAFRDGGFLYIFRHLEHDGFNGERVVQRICTQLDIENLWALIAKDKKLFKKHLVNANIESMSHSVCFNLSLLRKVEIGHPQYETLKDYIKECIKPEKPKANLLEDWQLLDWSVTLEDFQDTSINQAPRTMWNRDKLFNHLSAALDAKAIKKQLGDALGAGTTKLTASKIKNKI